MVAAASAKKLDRSGPGNLFKIAKKTLRELPLYVTVVKLYS